MIDTLAHDVLFASDPQKQQSRQTIKELAGKHGIVLSSLYNMYRERARSPQQFPFTVPALNIRGLSFDFCRAILRAAIKQKVGAFIIELARSEMEYTDQRPDDIAAVALAAGIREGYTGFLFLQGDHYRINTQLGVDEEVRSLEKLIEESYAAGFFNVDIDASTTVDFSKSYAEDQQARNGEITAHLTRYIRRLGRDSNGAPLTIGGEIGEIGGRNSTAEDLHGFMSVFKSKLGNVEGISKVAVQTGTRHGGIPGPGGSVVKARLDFATLNELSRLAREEYGLAGAVQHGASTLPEELFGKFPDSGTAEIHLSTEFQNIIFHHPAFPEELREEIDAYVDQHYAKEHEPTETEEQFLYPHRKFAWGHFQKTIAELPSGVRQALAQSLEDKVAKLFWHLRVENTRDIVDRLVTLPLTAR